jgi:hypothetical protein
MDGLDRENVATIQIAVSQVNSFVEMFLQNGEFKRNQEVLFFDWQITKPRESVCKHITAPRATKWPPFHLTLSMVTERDVILHLPGGGLQLISDRHSGYDPLHFPLLITHGEISWL